MKRNFLMPVLALCTVLSSCSKDEILLEEEGVATMEEQNIPLTRSCYDDFEITTEMQVEYWEQASLFQQTLVKFTKSVGKSLTNDQWGQIWSAMLHYKNVKVSVYNKRADYNPAYVYKIEIVDGFFETSYIADKRIFDLNGEFIGYKSLDPEETPKYWWNKSLSGKYEYYGYNEPVGVHNIPSGTRSGDAASKPKLSYGDDERYWDNTRKFTDLVFECNKKLTGLSAPRGRVYDALQDVYYNYHNLDVYFFFAIDADGKPTKEIFASVYEGDEFRGRSNIIYVPNMICSNGKVWAFPLEFSGVLETKIIPTWER